MSPDKAAPPGVEAEQVGNERQDVTEVQERQGVTEAQVRREMLRMANDASRRRAWMGALVAVALALLLGFLAARFAFELVDVRSNAMADAARSGDVVLCVRSDAMERLARLGISERLGLGEVTKGSVALVRYRENGLSRQTLRRVIATGGDEVVVDGDGKVTVNGEALAEPYAAYRSGDESQEKKAASGGALVNPFESAGHPADEDLSQDRGFLEDGGDLEIDDVKYPLVVPEGTLFVLCDDRDNLLDSRSGRFGLVKEKDVLGLAFAILWPAYRAGRVQANAVAG